MAVYDELEQVRRQNADGILLADQVVEFAKNPKTALHSNL